MSPADKATRLLGYGALVAAAGMPVGAAAQTAMVTGVVRAALDDAPLAHVVVTVNHTLVTMTDVDGTFRLGPVTAGPGLLTIRSIGFAPVDILFNAPPAPRDLYFEPRLHALVVRLDTIRVEAAGPVRLAREGFFDRQALGFGHFITRADIERRAPLTTSDLFATLPPRVRSVCRLWIDGIPVQTHGGIENTVDLLLPPQVIAGLEIYSGASTTPIRFSRNATRCTVVAWTR